MVLRQVAFDKNVEGWRTAKWPTPRLVAIMSSLIPASAAQPDLRHLERAAAACLRPTKALADKKRGIYGNTNRRLPRGIVSSEQS